MDQISQLNFLSSVLLKLDVLFLQFCVPHRCRAKEDFLQSKVIPVSNNKELLVHFLILNHCDFKTLKDICLYLYLIMYRNNIGKGDVKFKKFVLFTTVPKHLPFEAVS